MDNSNDINSITINIFRNIVQHYMTNEHNISQIIEELSNGIQNIPVDKQKIINEKIQMLNNIDISLLQNNILMKTDDSYNKEAIKQIFRLQGNIILHYIKSNTKSETCGKVISVLLSNLTNKIDVINEILEKKIEKHEPTLKPEPKLIPTLKSEMPNKTPSKTLNKTILKPPFLTGKSLHLPDNFKQDTHSATIPTSFSDVPNWNNKRGGGNNDEKYFKHKYFKYFDKVSELERIIS